MNRMARMLALAFVCLATVFPFLASQVSAHGHTEVGDYELVIGFHNEPAYQGEPNGLDLFVTNKTTKEKINGLEDTLKAELIYGDKKVELPIKAQWGEDGAYTAYVVPTVAGAYTWHISGTINDTPVDVSMTAGPGTFGEIQAKNAIAFPQTEPTASELTAQIQQAQAFGITGLVIGLLSLIAAAYVLLGRGRRTAQAAAPKPSPVATK